MCDHGMAEALAATTVEEFLAGESVAQQRLELVSSRVYALTGARHGNHRRACRQHRRSFMDGIAVSRLVDLIDQGPAGTGLEIVVESEGIVDDFLGAPLPA
jgi:hypothetical protein